jgi:2-desacetyl-2-hydroxyethyl bacteriochlorophyllide A dehydrogenase
VRICSYCVKNSVVNRPVVSFSEGTQIDLVAVAVHAINSCRPLVNNFCCAVIGDGPLGIITAQVAKAQGASNVTIFAKHEYKRKIAEELGIDAVIPSDDDLFYQYFKNTFDIVFETVGGRQACTLNNAITITRPNGKVAVLGVFDFGYQPAIEVRTAFYKELTIVGINSYTKNRYKSDFGDALAMVNNGSINIKNIISHKFALQDYKAAFSLITNGSNRIKILFEDS